MDFANNVVICWEGAKLNSEKLYYKAQFSSLLKKNREDIYTLGALCFTGEHRKARDLAQSLDSHSPFEKAFIQFHLGISYTRTSHYRQAKRQFKENLLLAKAHPKSSEIQFLAFQGLGFFNYFFSRHRQSLKATYHAQKSLLAAEKKTHRPLFQILSLDLEGHNLIQLFRIHQGIKTLEQALQVAQSQNIESFANSLNFSILLYESQFIHSPSHATKKLMKALSELPSHDDYSRSELVFLISNLMMLQGQYKKAQEFLSEHYKVIYETENKRQMGQLNFRMTYNMFRQGAFEQALFLAKTARSNLNPKTDKGLMCRILGLEIKILKAMGEPHQDTMERLASLDSEIDSLIIKRSNARMLSREFVINKGEDPIGDHVERLSNEKTATLYSDFLKKEMAGLLGDFFEIPPGQEAIVINAPKNTCFVCLKDYAFVIEKSLGPTLTKLTRALGEKKCSKEELIQKVWGYSEYDPLRHDSLIYSSMARLRNLFKINESQLFFDGESYQLNITVIDGIASEKGTVFTPKLSQETRVHKTKEEITKLPSDLNYRQVKTLNDEHFDQISVKNYADRFEIVTMTALRDLKKLCEYGYLKRMGKGRATRYLKTFQQE